MILAVTPFAEDMNLGRAYNEAMALLPEDAWAAFIDHDAMWTTRRWHAQLEEAVSFKPDAGAFTAVTNRIHSAWQRVGDQDNHDVAYHRGFGEARLGVRTLLDVTGAAMGGVVMCISKRAWRAVGGFVDGMMCVDHKMHFALRDSGRRVYCVEGLYVYHWRRAFGDRIPKAPRAAGCPCSGTTGPGGRLKLP